MNRFRSFKAGKISLLLASGCLLFCGCSHAASSPKDSGSASVLEAKNSSFQNSQASTSSTAGPVSDVPDAIQQAAPEQIVSVDGLDETQIRNSFYAMPVSEQLVEAMDGDFYSSKQSFIRPEDLALVRVLYTDFDGNTKVGELIVNQLIEDDVEEIFYELYKNGYPIQRLILPYGYYADDNAIMKDGISRALAFTWDENNQPMEHEHSLGLAIDLNSLYNPQVIVNEDGTTTILPPEAEPYADRSVLQPHMMDENDLAVRLFKEHGFTWGGEWEGRNDYQHFEKDFNHDTGHLDPSMNP